MSLLTQIVKHRTSKKNRKNFAVTFSTLAGNCLQFHFIRSSRRNIPVRDSRLMRGSVEGAGAIGGLAPASFVFLVPRATFLAPRFMTSKVFAWSASYI